MTYQLILNAPESFSFDHILVFKGLVRKTLILLERIADLSQVKSSEDVMIPKHESLISPNVSFKHGSWKTEGEITVVEPVLAVRGKT